MIVVGYLENIGNVYFYTCDFCILGLTGAFVMLPNFH